jgi:creatinine amidohydrolase
MKSVQFMNWQDFDEFRRQTDLVLMPFGAVEVYGPHLPMGSDGIAATALAERVADRVPAFVAPLVPVGYSRNLLEFPGTLSVRPAALVEYARDIAESFIRWGIRRILFLNGHNGNTPYLSQLGIELEDTYDVRCAQVDWWRFIQPLSADLVASDVLPYGHAGEFGTSVLLHLAPHHVVSERAPRTLPADDDPFPDVLRFRSYTRRTDTGTLGDATVGNADKGALVLERAVARVVAFIQSEQFVAP